MNNYQLHTNNGIIHYWKNKNKNNSKCIVFTHGMTADHSMFESQVSYFSDKYSVITWDMPMHGLSRPYNNFSFRNTAQHLYSILKKENISKIILVGMSMGGFPSQLFSHMYPEMIEGFIALDTLPLNKKYYSKKSLFFISFLPSLIKCFPEKQIKKSLATSICYSSYAYDKTLTMLKPFTKSDIIFQMSTMFKSFLIENTIDTNFCFPGLILLGEHDNISTLKKLNTNWSKDINYDIHLIKDAGHFSNADNPNQVNFEIETFIGNL